MQRVIMHMQSVADHHQPVYLADEFIETDEVLFILNLPLLL